MASVSDWKVPASAQPKPEDYAYDLDLALAAIVGLRATIRRRPSAPSEPVTASSSAATGWY
jgi:hypothetical protein